VHNVNEKLAESEVAQNRAAFYSVKVSCKVSWVCVTPIRFAYKGTPEMWDQYWSSDKDMVQV